jgi:hypothetical protein
MKVFSRQRIGLRAPNGSYSPNGKLRFASIHHGGPVGKAPLSFGTASQTWRQYQAYHQGNNGWTDIGYHVGIDGLGRLYKGRPATAVPAAVGNHNTGSIGIVFMQDGRHYKLNALQRRTLRILFEKGEKQLGIPPLKNLAYVKGHREFSGHTTNECPGDLILNHLKWRRSKYA